uniref:Uncharacterized protein n=1 Tax=Arundo donax TaxID=35708 RepID=A0A0A9EW86_ARUDO
MFSPTFLLVGQPEVASMVDQLARLEPIQELLVSILALSGLRMSPRKFSIKK